MSCMSGKADLMFFAGNLQKKKGAQGVIEVENPNLVKIKNLKVKDVDVSATSIHTHLCAWMSLLLHVECFLGSYQKLRQNIKNCSD
jgi:hypothetical protein